MHKAGILVGGCTHWPPSWAGVRAEATRWPCPWEPAMSLAPAASVDQKMKALSPSFLLRRDRGGPDPGVSWDGPVH